MKNLVLILSIAILGLLAACSRKVSPETAALAASLQEPGIFLLDFTTQGNADCDTMKPIVETALAKYGDRVRHVVIDTQEQPILAQGYAADTVPFYILVHDNNVITNHPGPASAAAFGKWLDTYVPKR